jgi:large subunit ribosomal protein L24
MSARSAKNPKIHVKAGDTVELISGRDFSASEPGARPRGKVLEVSPREGKLIVEGRNIVTKHAKPRKQGQQGGILKVEGALYASKVMLVCPKCDKPTRIGHKFSTDGKKTRVCKKCGAEI